MTTTAPRLDVPADLVHALWAYHHWANRRLFDVTAALGEELAARSLGEQFSYPTLRRMFAHIYGADAFWLSVWKGQSLGALPGSDIGTLGELRERWDELESEQRRYVGALMPGDLGRVIDGKNTRGQAFRRPLGMMLLHVPNHATHHRSEIATMLTMASGSPPDSGINTYCIEVLDPLLNESRFTG
jgi:uncharacterized damage-inducible protein DinB